MAKPKAAFADAQEQAAIDAANLHHRNRGRSGDSWRHTAREGLRAKSVCGHASLRPALFVGQAAARRAAGLGGSPGVLNALESEGVVYLGGPSWRNAKTCFWSSVGTNDKREIERHLADDPWTRSGDPLDHANFALGAADRRSDVTALSRPPAISMRVQECGFRSI